MRILMLHQKHLPTLKSGLVEYFYQLIPQLKTRGIEPFFLTAPAIKTQNTLQYYGEWLQTPCYLFPFMRPRLFHFKKEFQPIIHLYQELNIDVIHAHGAYRSGYVAEYIAKKIKIPYVITSHSDISENSNRISKKTVKSRLIRILKHANHVTHLTPIMQAMSDTIYPAHHKSTIIGNGIDLEHWENKINIPHCHYFFAIGRLVKEKGFHILINAYAQLCSQLPHESIPHLVIAGSGKEEKSLRTLAQSFNLPIQNHIRTPENLIHAPPRQIIFTGELNRIEKKLWYRAAQFILFAPVWLEPFGIVQLEAAAAGVPLIVCKNPATDYLMQSGLSAHLIPENTPDSWAQELNKILILHSITELNAAAQNNRKLMAKFSWDHIADEYVKVYENVMLA